MSTPTIIRIRNGQAVLYDSGGVMHRTLCSGAASGVVNGDEALITMTNGSVRVYSLNGTLKRTI